MAYDLCTNLIRSCFATPRPQFHKRNKTAAFSKTAIYGRSFNTSVHRWKLIQIMRQCRFRRETSISDLKQSVSGSNEKVEPRDEDVIQDAVNQFQTYRNDEERSLINHAKHLSGLKNVVRPRLRPCIDLVPIPGKLLPSRILNRTTARHPWYTARHPWYSKS